jgi:hypothetical protein
VRLVGFNALLDGPLFMRKLCNKPLGGDSSELLLRTTANDLLIGGHVATEGDDVLCHRVSNAIGSVADSRGDGRDPFRTRDLKLEHASGRVHQTVGGPVRPTVEIRVAVPLSLIADDEELRTVTEADPRWPEYRHLLKVRPTLR